MKIEISNQQTRWKVRLLAVKAYCRWLMGQVQELDPERHWVGLSLALTDHAGIADVHAAYLGQPKTTDVISFAYPPVPPAVQGFTGDVIVNVDQAVEQGPRFAGIAQELALYIAHGCHHLTGADDATPVLRRRMRTVEEGWLRVATDRGLIEPLFPEQ